MPETDDQWTCDLCGRVTASPYAGGTGLSLEVNGRGADGEPGDWYVGFCSQEHAAEWLARPLPPAPGTDGTPAPPTTWGERAALTGCALVGLCVLALLLVGAWTVVRFLLDRS